MKTRVCVWARARAPSVRTFGTRLHETACDRSLRAVSVQVAVRT